MEDLLIQLWRGNIRPMEKEEGKEILELQRLIRINAEKMEGMLDAEQRRRLETYVDCIHEYYALFSEQAFCCGFRLGSGLIGQAWLSKD